MSCNENNAFIKFSKVKTGPTFTYSLKNYIDSKLVRSQNDHNIKYKFDNVIKNNPLLLLSGFENDEICINSNCKNVSKAIVAKYLSILSTSFSTMFPTINFNRLDLSKLNRVISIRAKVEPDLKSPLKFKITLQVRQYYLNIEKQIDALFKGVIRHASNFGVDHDSKLIKLLMNNESTETEYNMKMVEIGPRFDMDLYKIEEGFLNNKGSII